MYILHIGLHKTGSTYLQDAYFSKLDDVIYNPPEVLRILESYQSNGRLCHLCSDAQLQELAWKLEQYEKKQNKTVSV